MKTYKNANKMLKRLRTVAASNSYNLKSCFGKKGFS